MPRSARMVDDDGIFHILNRGHCLSLSLPHKLTQKLSQRDDNYPDTGGYRSTGHLWQGRYKSFVIQDNDHFVTVARYVEGNPVRAGLVESATEWCWSSHCGRIGMESDKLVSSLPVPFIGDWTEFVNTPMTPVELAKSRKLIIRQKSNSEEDEFSH